MSRRAVVFHVSFARNVTYSKAVELQPVLRGAPQPMHGQRKEAAKDMERATPAAACRRFGLASREGT